MRNGRRPEGDAGEEKNLSNVISARKNFHFAGTVRAVSRYVKSAWKKTAGE
jgi:hypothetical protein